MVLYHFQAEEKFGKVVWKQLDAGREHEAQDDQDVSRVKTQTEFTRVLDSNDFANQLAPRQQEILDRLDGMRLGVHGRVKALRNKYAPTLQGAVDDQLNKITEEKLNDSHVKFKRGLGLAIRNQASFLLNSDDMKFLTKKIEVCEDAEIALKNALAKASDNQADWKEGLEGLRKRFPRPGQRWEEFKVDFAPKSTSRKTDMQKAVASIKEKAIERKRNLEEAVHDKFDNGINKTENKFRSMYFRAFGVKHPEYLESFEGDFGRDMAKYGAERVIRAHIEELDDSEARNQLILFYSRLKSNKGREAYEFAKNRLSTEPRAVKLADLGKLPVGRHVKFAYDFLEKTVVPADPSVAGSQARESITNTNVEGNAYITGIKDGGKKVTLRVISAKGKNAALNKDKEPKTIEIDLTKGLFRLVRAETKNNLQTHQEVTQNKLLDEENNNKPLISFEALS